VGVEKGAGASRFARERLPFQIHQKGGLED
jgi:hypothetical protein